MSPIDSIHNVQKFLGKHLLGVVLAAKVALYVVVLAALSRREVMVEVLGEDTAYIQSGSVSLGMGSSGSS